MHPDLTRFREAYPIECRWRTNDSVNANISPELLTRSVIDIQLKTSLRKFRTDNREGGEERREE
jgi:hypothetical protein